MYHCDDENFKNEVVIINLNNLISLTLIPLTWNIGRAPNNASKWQMGFNSVFKELNRKLSLQEMPANN
jgi:hypothetical protein